MDVRRGKNLLKNEKNRKKIKRKWQKERKRKDQILFSDGSGWGNKRIK